MTPDELKKIRASMGLTQIQMADKLGLSLAGYQNLETGDKSVREVYALAVAALTGRPSQVRTGIRVLNEPDRVRLAELKDGDVFCLPVLTGGRMVGMIGGTEDERRVIVFGSPDHPNQTHGAYWLGQGGGEISAEIVIRLSDPIVELARGPQGYASPTNQPSNGAIVIDEAGARWIYIKQATSEFYRLSDGQAGLPSKRRDYYNSWRLVWTPRGQDAVVELMRNGEQTPLLKPPTSLG